MPPEVTVLGSYHVEMGEIINGETKIDEVCICGGGALDAEVEEKEEEITDGKKVKYVSFSREECSFMDLCVADIFPGI